MFLIVFKSVCHKIFASQKEKLYTFKQLKHTQYFNACSIEYKVKAEETTRRCSAIFSTTE